jgi:hypothetical protein
MAVAGKSRGAEFRNSGSRLRPPLSFCLPVSRFWQTLYELREERGFDFQLAWFAQANRPSITGGEIMSTRAMIAVQFNQNGPFALYYRHCDGCPTGLGIELMEGLQGRQDIHELLAQIHAEQTGHLVDEPQAAYPQIQGDLEWIYTIRMDPDHAMTSLSIYKTSNPYTRREFVFPVWHSYVKYLPRRGLPGLMRQIEQMAYITLSALEAFEKADETRQARGGEETTAVSPPPALPDEGHTHPGDDRCQTVPAGSRRATMQICGECGRSVAPGSGWFVNRVPDFNTVEERRVIGRPFPEGDFVCAECDQRGGSDGS